MLIYEHGYVCQYIERRAWREGGKTKYPNYLMRPIKETEKEYEENIGKLWNSYISCDYASIISETRDFLTKYPNNTRHDSHLREMASAYEELGDDKSAKQIYEEIITRRVSKYDIEEAIRQIEMLKKRDSRQGGSI